MTPAIHESLAQWRKFLCDAGIWNGIAKVPWCSAHMFLFGKGSPATPLWPVASKKQKKSFVFITGMGKGGLRRAERAGENICILDESIKSYWE